MKLVAEVAFIRPILIILLVVYHAFLIYGGGWTQPVGYVDVLVYKDIAVLSYSSMLETFVFISGYLFFWGILKANKSVELKSILKSKFNRLLVPAWIWSILYYFIIDNTNSLKQIVLSGGAIGHLWFLPMLFWCFVFGWVFLKVTCNPKIKLMISLVLAVFSRLPLPFMLSEALYYQFFFLLGYFFVLYRDYILQRLSSSRLFFMWFINICVLIVYLIYGDVIGSISQDTLIEKVCFFSVRNSERIFVSFIGVSTLYITALYYTSKRVLSSRIVELGACCFGIYIFQQFILKNLYYSTAVPSIVGPYWLPWFSVVITLIVSCVLTVFLRKSKLFRAIL